MRVLIINKFLYPNGGSETYIFKLGEALEQHGHEVQYFGMEHEGCCVGNRVNAYTSDMDFHGGSKLSKLTYPIKTIYSKEARVQLRKVLDDFQPDVCHLNNFNYVLANGEYGIGGFVFERLIPSFTNLVFLFMMVSCFGMCCGYYQKIIDQKISVEDFYKKRYIKIWPYFALLCALDFVISPSKESLFEVFANLTLCQGLLPNAKISVIGVSWTLAVIFVFYMLFPFFCFLIGNKKRAWGVAIVALVFNWLCRTYFFDGNHIVDFSPRTNIVYDAIYFIAGGLIFLYRKELAEFVSKHKVIAGAILLIATVAYFAVGGNTLTMLFFCVAALAYTLGCNRGGVLVNPVAKFLGGISFEIYLCHMVIYRVLEKLHLVHLLGNGLLAYIFTAIAVVCGSVVFSVCAKWFLNKVETFLKERVNNRRVNHV